MRVGQSVHQINLYLKNYIHVKVQMNYTFPDTSTHVWKRFRASMCWGMKPHYDQGMGISQISGTRVAAPRATTDDTLWGFVVFHTLAHLSQVTQHPLIFCGFLPTFKLRFHLA